jgi:preprotein translocase subunit SecE
LAKETRRQRRDARRQLGDGAAGAGAGARSRASRAQQVRPGAQPANLQTGRREPKQRGKFAKESWGELKKVDWPGRAQVMQGTIVVLIACAIVGVYLYAADQALRPLVRQVFLGQ